MHNLHPGANLHPGSNLHLSANLHPLCRVHMPINCVHLGYYLGVCVLGERGGFLDISTAECVVETFILHAFKGRIRKAAYS